MNWRWLWCVFTFIAHGWCVYLVSSAVIRVVLAALLFYQQHIVICIFALLGLHAKTLLGEKKLATYEDRIE